MSTHDALTRKVLEICAEMHSALGPGLPESVYEEILCAELSAAGIPYERGRTVPIRYRNTTAAVSAGLLIDNSLLVRLDTASQSHGLPHLQAVLRHGGFEKGLLLKFGERQLQHGLALPHSTESLQIGASSAATGSRNQAITPEQISAHGLSSEEYQRICGLLGREPNFTELGVFSVMWSEHCSYKNTRLELKKFPTDGATVLVRAGEENAGVLDIGDGWAVAFKIESHNHPSAIEPFQGAATGIGGIVRDIFTMGARPAFFLNSLRFGPLDALQSPNAHRNRALLQGVVAGIAHYGNCIGVPTIGGEIDFDPAYDGNPLVNAFCLGVLRHDQIARGAATGIGNPVYYLGSETGRDGLAGAAFASRDLTDQSREDRPAVQVGDPFRGKLLLEACLELLATGAVAGIQDMGAAGLTCSTCETASRGGSGVEIDLAHVPQREPGMTPYEILLSESQERMLIIAHKGSESKVEEVFRKWDLPFAKIGTVTDDGLMRVKNSGTTVVEIPARALADDAPVYEREAAPRSPAPTFNCDDVRETEPATALRRLLADPGIASKRWVYEQYDHMVGTGTVLLPGSDAAVFHIREADKFLAATADCNAAFCAGDPREGARLAVAEAARNLACSGATPIGLTDNLNFGNPYKPENFFDLREAVEGLAEVCRALNIPVTGGNVSLYNESPAGTIPPTPVVAMVGVIDKVAHITRQHFQAAGDVILLCGLPGNDLGCSRYLSVLHGIRSGYAPPRLDLDRELPIQNAVRDLIRTGLVKSAHDCSEGGLAVALAECCFAPEQTFGVDTEFSALDGVNRSDALLFNETPSRIVLSVARPNADAAAALLSWRNIPCQRLGVVTEDGFRIRTPGGVLTAEPADLRRAWSDSLAAIMQETPVHAPSAAPR